MAGITAQATRQTLAGGAWGGVVAPREGARRPRRPRARVVQTSNGRKRGRGASFTAHSADVALQLQCTRRALKQWGPHATRAWRARPGAGSDGGDGGRGWATQRESVRRGTFWGHDEDPREEGHSSATKRATAASPGRPDDPLGEVAGLSTISPPCSPLLPFFLIRSPLPSFLTPDSCSLLLLHLFPSAP